MRKGKGEKRKKVRLPKVNTRASKREGKSMKRWKNVEAAEKGRRKKKEQM